MGVNPRENTLYIGTRWRKDGKTGEQKLGTDASHASTAGGYLAGAVWYLVLFNANEVPASYAPGSLTPDQAAELRTFARAAVQSVR